MSGGYPHQTRIAQVITPTLTLPREGGGDFQGILLFPPVKGKGTFMEPCYALSTGGRGLLWNPIIPPLLAAYGS
jgi:hypothetical protein